MLIGGCLNSPWLCSVFFFFFCSTFKVISQMLHFLWGGGGRGMSGPKNITLSLAVRSIASSEHVSLHGCECLGIVIISQTLFLRKASFVYKIGIQHTPPAKSLKTDSCEQFQPFQKFQEDCDSCKCWSWQSLIIDVVCDNKLYGVNISSCLLIPWRL